MPAIAVARFAMATRFEIVLHGQNAADLRAAGEEALREIERLEAQLSLYRPTSEITRINAAAARQPVRIEPRLFALLRHAQQLHQETGGAFDITIAPLMRCWGFMGGPGELPEPAALAEARARSGMQHVRLNEKELTVEFTRPGVMLDLGAIGKGYALQEAADLLREAGITSALLHGGTSTICAIGSPPDAGQWTVALEDPVHETGAPPALTAAAANSKTSPTVLATIGLRDETLSVSAIWGKAFEADGKVYGHVIDPRTGEPAQGAALAAVILPSATESDALSTALLLLGSSGQEAVASLRAGMQTLVLNRSPVSSEVTITACGNWRLHANKTSQ